VFPSVFIASDSERRAASSSGEKWVEASWKVSGSSSESVSTFASAPASESDELGAFDLVGRDLGKGETGSANVEDMAQACSTCSSTSVHNFKHEGTV